MTTKIKCCGIEYRIHEYCDAYPDLEGEALDRLADSIAERGLDLPILRYGGQITDGKNRLRGCDRAAQKIQRDKSLTDAQRKEALDRAKPRFQDMVISSRDAALIDKEIYDKIKALNDERRHMDQSQKSLTAGKLLLAFRKHHPELDAKPEEKNGEAIAEERPESAPTVPQVAEDFGVSERLVHHGVKVAEEGSAKVQTAVERGEVAVADAAAISHLPAQRQDAALERVQSGKARTLRSAAGKRSKVKPIKGNRQLTFDDDIIDGHFGHLVRALDDRRRSLKPESGERDYVRLHDKAHKQLDEFITTWKALKKLKK